MKSELEVRRKQVKLLRRIMKVAERDISIIPPFLRSEAGLSGLASEIKRTLFEVAVLEQKIEVDAEN